MKVFNITCCILFVLFAALQYNDPDPYVWMPIYLYSAWLCFKAAQHKFYPKAYLFGIIVYAIYALYLLFDKTGVMNWILDHDAESMVQTMQAKKPWIEESREFFGLMILIVTLSVDWAYGKKAAPSTL